MQLTHDSLQFCTYYPTTCRLAITISLPVTHLAVYFCPFSPITFLLQPTGITYSKYIKTRFLAYICLLVIVLLDGMFHHFATYHIIVNTDLV